MNERIKELAKQAGLKQRIWNSLGKELPMWQEDPDNPGLEKFAELIVRECVKVCSGVEEDGELSPELGTFADGALLCREEIKAYFGFEE
jgi:hypothetical protein